MSVNKFGFRSVIKHSVNDNSKFISLAKNLQEKVDRAGDNMTGDLNMGNNKIISLSDPISDDDACNKRYVQSILNEQNIITELNKRYVQSKLNEQNIITKLNFDTLTNTKLDKSINENLDMNGFTIVNVKNPVNSSDASNKLYVQINSVIDETNIASICKIGEVILLVLANYNLLGEFNSKQLITSSANAISMYDKYRYISEVFAANLNDLANCTVFLDLKVNILNLIQVLPKDIFQKLKEELNKEKLFSTPERGIRKRYRRFLIKYTNQVDPSDINEELQLLLNKNLLILDIGFVYLIDSLLYILLKE